ncbi:MAG: SDR family NAD(P)-dependent oxidoreductase [Fidelibacterota bacterium]
MDKKYALITGASSGLGADFARQIAAKGWNLILVARREQRLEQVKQEILTNYNVDILVIPADLTNPNAPQEIYQSLQNRRIEVDILINNAGAGLYGPFHKTDLQRQLTLLQLNMTSVVQLTYLFLNDMLKRQTGYLLFVASIGAFQPTPLYATYAATKSFILPFGLALNRELHSTGVSSTVLSPGVTKSEFLAVAGQKPNLFQRLTMMESSRVVRSGLRAMFKRRGSVVPGTVNKLTVFFTYLLPRRVTTAMAHWAMLESK